LTQIRPHAGGNESAFINQTRAIIPNKISQAWDYGK